MPHDRDQLNGKERLTRIFNNQDIDRIPVWMLFPLKPWSLAVNVHAIPSYERLNHIIFDRTDIIHRINFLHLPLCGTHHKLDKKSAGTPLVKYAGDLDAILEKPFQLQAPDIKNYEEDLAALGDRGIPCIMLSDPVGFLKPLVGETEFPMLLYEEQDRVSAFFDEIHRRAIEYYKWFLERNLGDVYWLDGAEYIVPPFMSPSFFEKWTIKYQSDLVRLIRSYGKKTIIHCHGKIGRVLRHFKTIGMEALHPIEAPPMGDTTLKHAREILGAETVFIGNIQYGDLFFGHTEEEIEAMTLDIIEESRRGPVILAVTGSPTVDPLPPQAERNYMRIIETCLTKGFY
jgi:hypothetical protein